MSDVPFECRVQHAAITCRHGRSDDPAWDEERPEVRHVFTVEVRDDALRAAGARRVVSGTDGSPAAHLADAGAAAEHLMGDPPVTDDGWTPGACLTLTAYADARRPAGADGEALAWGTWLTDTAGVTTTIPHALAALLASARSAGRGPLGDSVVLWVRVLEVHPALRGVRLGHWALAHAMAALRTGPGDLAILEAAPVPTRFDAPGDPPLCNPASRRAHKADAVRKLTRYYARAGYIAVPERFTGAREATDAQILVRPLGDAAVAWCTRLDLGSDLPAHGLL